MSRAQLTSTVEQNTGGAVAPFVAGKNKVINGDFGIWQRGTSFTALVNGTYTADRFYYNRDGSGSTVTVSQQTFAPGTAPVAGYESAYYYQHAQTVAGTGGSYNTLDTKIEDVRTFAGQTVTLSFWAKGDAARTISVNVNQNFGSGGSGGVSYNFGSITTTTSWARYSLTYTLPSIAGKTIGTGSNIQIDMLFPVNTVMTISLWGLQLEAGSVATPFTTASGTLQGELALCQRYYYREAYSGGYTGYMLGYYDSSTDATFVWRLPQTMRTSPSFNASSYTQFIFYDTGNRFPSAGPSLQFAQPSAVTFTMTTSGATAGQGVILRNYATSSSYLEASAEL